MSAFGETPRDDAIMQSISFHASRFYRQESDFDDKRLPIHIAFRIIILLSVSAWVLVISAAVSLFQMWT